MTNGGWEVYGFIDARGQSVIAGWLSKNNVPKTQRAKLRQRLDKLKIAGPTMLPGFMVGPVGDTTRIYKLRVYGSPQLRPHACKGPFGDKEITLLVGAIEKGGKLRPADVVRRALVNLEILEGNRNRRTNERIT